MTTFRALYRSAKLPLVILAMLVAVLSFAAVPAMAEFGLQKFALSARNQNGTPDVQAGSHPYALTNTFVLHLNPANLGNETRTLQEGTLLKNVRVELPPGFVGDPNATPHCSYQAFVKKECSNETAVGVATTYLAIGGESIAAKMLSALIVWYLRRVSRLSSPSWSAAIRPCSCRHRCRDRHRLWSDDHCAQYQPDRDHSREQGDDLGVPADPAHNDIRGGCLRDALEGWPKILWGSQRTTSFQ